MADCTRRPANNTQLDSGEPTRAFDCGVEKTRDALDYASCGRIDVNETKLRELMGKPGKRPTDPRDWKKAIESDFVAAKFKAKGLHAPKARLLDGVDVAIARADLDDGRFLIGAGWYATLNDLAPNKSASRTFGDNHAFGVFGRVSNDRTNENDPLADGRPDGAGGRYPKGTQRIRWDVLRAIFGDVRLRTRDATGRIISERKLGRGKFLGISIARSKPLDDTGTTPDPTPAIDWPAELAALGADLADASATLAKARLDVGDADEAVAAIGRQIANLAHEVEGGSK